MRCYRQTRMVFALMLMLALSSCASTRNAIFGVSVSKPVICEEEQLVTEYELRPVRFGVDLYPDATIERVLERLNWMAFESEVAYQDGGDVPAVVDTALAEVQMMLAEGIDSRLTLDGGIYKNMAFNFNAMRTAGTQYRYNAEYLSNCITRHNQKEAENGNRED